MLDDIKLILREVLSLGARADSFSRETHLLGNLPELDSAAVIGVITALEEQFGITVDDDDITAETFETVGALEDFVKYKLGH